MKTTRWEAFRDALLTTGSYRTAPECRAAVRAKPGALTTFGYTWDLMRAFRLTPFCQAFGRFDRERWVRLCFAAVTGAEARGLEVSFEGFARRKAHDGPVVYLCNHMSTIETQILPPALLGFGPFCTIAKASLAHLPLLEKAAAKVGIVPISRTSPREDLVNMLRIGEERVRAGESFILFPQGTRQDVFSRAKFSSIGAKIAERAGCPICPIVVDTRCQLTRTSGFLRKVFRDFGPFDPTKDIRCCCGPIVPCGRARDMHAASFDWMATQLEAWGLPTSR